MGTNCAPLLAGLFLYSYEADRDSEIRIKYTTDTGRSASYLDLHLDIDSVGWLRMNLYDRLRRGGFNFPQCELAIHM